MSNSFEVRSNKETLMSRRFDKDEAITEARRLAGLYPKQNFRVLECTEIFSTAEDPR